MAKHKGFDIEKVDGEYRASIGGRVVSAGWPSAEMAKQAVDTRRTRRERLGLDPAG